MRQYARTRLNFNQSITSHACNICRVQYWRFVNKGECGIADLQIGGKTVFNKYSAPLILLLNIWLKGIVICKCNFKWTIHAKMTIPDLQRYPWNIHLIQNVEEILSFFLNRKVCYSDHLSIASNKQEMCELLLQRTRKWKLTKNIKI